MRQKGLWYMPGRLYDLAFEGMFKGLKRRVASAVEEEGLYPWLDICCGTGSQLRGLGSGEAGRYGDRSRGPYAGEGRLRDGQTGAIGTEGLAKGPGGPVFGLDKSAGMVRYAAARASGIPFVCGDAVRLPFKDGSFRAVSVSFGLHDKSPEVRSTMMLEARRVLAPGGRLIAVDFENPWSFKSKVGALVVRAVERLAGGEHYRNGREFLSRGGLQAFLRESGFVETARHEIEVGSISIVVASPR